MEPNEAEQVARLLQQYHAAFAFLAEALLPANRDRTVAQIISGLGDSQCFGGAFFAFVAVAFIYSHECVFVPLGRPASIYEPIDLAALGVTRNDRAASDPGDPRAVCLRHLRNCFGHGRFIPTTDGTRITSVTLDDFLPNGTPTFHAQCNATILADLAERVLMASRAEVVARITPPTTA
jgi:hypothetical protein